MRERQIRAPAAEASTTCAGQDALSSTESPVPPRCCPYCPCSATGEPLLSSRMRQQVLSPPQELLLLPKKVEAQLSFQTHAYSLLISRSCCATGSVSAMAASTVAERPSAIRIASSRSPSPAVTKETVFS